MGLMRHLTRSKRPSRVFELDHTPSTTSTTPPSKGRPLISLPTELISTTNMLSYNAPSVASMRVVSSSSTATTASSRTSQHSLGDSDNGLTDASSLTSISSPGSPVERSGNNFFTDKESNNVNSPSSPTSSAEPALSDGYTTSVDSTPVQTPALELDEPGYNLYPISTTAPVLPRRAPSHSKREHVRLAHRRSMRMLRPGSTISMDSSFLNTPLSACGMPMHPFSSELEQLSEAVEEFSSAQEGNQDTATDNDDDNTNIVAADISTVEEDVVAMATMGLQKYRVDQYLLEIRELQDGLFSSNEE